MDSNVVTSLDQLPAPPQTALPAGPVLSVDDLPAPPAANQTLGQVASLDELPVPPAATDQPGYLAQFAKGAVTGAESAADPSGKLGLLPTDHYTRERSVVEMVGEAVGNLATGKGIATALGAGIGAIGGPPGVLAGVGAGNLLYSLYQGIGGEVGRAASVNQDFNPLRAAANVALDLNPLISADAKLVKVLGLSSKLGTVARVAGQVAGHSAVEYSYTGQAASAATAGAIGLLMAYPTYRLMRTVAPNTLPTVDTAATVYDAFKGDDGARLLERASAKLADLGEAATKAPAEAANDPEFRRFVVQGIGQPLGKVDRAFTKFTGNWTPEQFDQSWQSFQLSRVMLDTAKDIGTEMANGLGAFEDVSPKIKGLDARFAMSAIDRRAGSNLEGLADTFSKSGDAFQVKALGYFTAATKVRKAAQKAGLNDYDLGRALDGQLESLPAAKQAALTELSQINAQGRISILDSARKVMDDVGDQLRASGADVGQITNYIPLKELRGPDLAEALRTRLTTIQQQALAAGKRSLLDVTTDEASEYKSVVARVLGKDVDALSDGDLIGAAKSAVLGRGKTTLGFTPGAMFERVAEDIPDFTREYHFGKLVTSYINTNLKAVEFDAAFKQGQTYAVALRAMGLPNSAQYLETYMADQSGQSRGLVAATQAGIARLADAGRQLEGSGSALARVAGRTLQAAPDFVSWANSLVYPSYLGLPNVHAPVMRMSHTWFTTAPELGFLQGSRLVAQATFDVVKDLANYAKAGKAPFAAMEADLQSRGVMGAHAHVDLTTEAGLSSTLRQYTDKINSAAMWVFSKADTANRAIAYKVGQRWGQEVVKGEAGAIANLAKLGPGTQAMLRSTPGIMEDPERLGHELGDWLIGRTQFRFGPAQQSEFGRAAGSAFTMFTKWPLMVGSDIIDHFDKAGPGVAWADGVRHLASKYMAPLGALYAAQAAVTATGGHPGPAYDLVIGNLPDYSPLLSVRKYDIFGGPGVEFAREALKGAEGGLEGDATAGRKALRTVLKSYLPPVSAVVNELDRWKKADGQSTSVSKDMINALTGG